MVEKPIERDDLLEAGRLALDQVVERLQGRYTSKPDRLALMRVVSQLIPALDSCLKNGEIDELRAEVEKIKEALNLNGKD